MHIKKRVYSAVLVLLCTAFAVLYGTGPVKAPRKPESSSASGFLAGRAKDTIYLWYTDEDMTSFLNSAAVSFGEEHSIRVIPVLTAEGEYLEAINQASLHTAQMPDLYLIDNDSLEKAYLAGLASETGDAGTVCNAENFPGAALNAVSYQGKTIAYPLYFETSVLLYNETYLEQWSAQQADKTDEGLGEEVVEKLKQGVFDTLDDLLTVADTFDVPEGVEGIMEWDVSDIFYNYWFVGHYLVAGGAAGDDRDQIDIDNEETVLCLKTYQLMNQFFSMETDTINYESVIQDFIDGKIMFTVATTDVIARMEKAQEDGSFVYDYGVAMMPDVSEELKSASLSVTNCVVVNGYSDHKQLANAFAAYLTNDCAEDIYEKTGKLAAKSDTDQDNGAAQIFKLEYADSVSLPKMMETGNFWMQMEVLFTKVWNGENVEKLVTALAEQISTQIQ